MAHPNWNALIMQGRAIGVNQPLPDEVRNIDELFASDDEDGLGIESAPLTRAEAIQILTDANVEFKKNASNAVLFKLVANLEPCENPNPVPEVQTTVEGFIADAATTITD